MAAQASSELEAKILLLESKITDLQNELRQSKDNILELCVEKSLGAIRDEYTSLPRFVYHLPMDYDMVTMPPAFDPPVILTGEALPLPPPLERHGHIADDSVYLDWGKYDHDVIMQHVRQGFPSLDKLSVMDFGCSSGRVLRHFHREVERYGWGLTGVDVSSRHIEWLRRYFPNYFRVYVGSVVPTLPFESGSFDVVYGMSVFTHLKFLWDMWLLELRRVLKPGGMLIQTIHTENAWRFFHRQSQSKEWNAAEFGGLVISEPQMPADYVYIGNIDNNNVFWKEKVAIEFWKRYFDEVEIFPPPEQYNYQSWVVARKRA